MQTWHSARETNRTCIITMVHGTWGGARPSSWWHALLRAVLAWYRAARALFGAAPRAPLWYDENSAFRRRLESKLRRKHITATFRIFQWSGANSVFHRARAADELTNLLASDRDDVNSIVIAHSHGGNVAFRAISKLGSRGARIHLVTLATPFLRVFPTWKGPDRWVVTIVFAVAIGFGVFLLGRAAGAPEWLQKALSPLGPSDWWAFHLDVFSFLAFLPIGIAVLAVSYGLTLLLINPSPRRAYRQLARQAKTWGARPFEIAEAVNYVSAAPQAPNLLVIRGVDDEAALALAFGSIATAINRLVLRAVSQTVFVPLYLAPHLLYGLFPKWLQPFMQAAYFILMGLIFFLILVLLCHKL